MASILTTKRLRSPRVATNVPTSQSRVCADEPKPIKRLCFGMKNLSYSKSSILTPPTSSDDIAAKPSKSNSDVVQPAKSNLIPETDQKNQADVRKEPGFPLYVVRSVEARKDCMLLLVSAPSSDPSKVLKNCVLRGFWRDTVISVEDKVMVIGTFDESNTCIIDNETSFLITHPDTLISPTLIGGASYCTRKALLQDMVRSETTMEMFIGTLVHDLMQRIVVAISKVAPSNNMKDVAESSVSILTYLLRDPKYRQDMYALNVDESKVSEVASSFIPKIEQWAWSEFAKPDREVVDIEEWIWSPCYGVKGRVDMTLKIGKAIKPLEIKTGKASFGVSHTGQVLLYTLLLSEKYGEAIDEGILYYAKTGEWKTVAARQNDLGALIRMRNDLSHYLKKPHLMNEQAVLNLPSPLNNSRTCSTCQVNTMCSLFYKTIEEKKGIRKQTEEEYIHQLVQLKTVHLSPKHLEYFEKWVTWLYMEIYYFQSNVSVLDMWCSEPDPLFETQGKEISVAGLHLTEIKNTPNRQLIYCLHGKKETTAVLNSGDLVILREDSPMGMVADLCTIKSIEKSPVVKLELHADRFYENLTLSSKVLRIDKYVYSASSMAGSFDGLLRLMESGLQSDRLRGLLLDKILPRMISQINKTHLLQCKPLLKSVPKEQQSAVLKTLIMQDYIVVDSKGWEETNKFASVLLRVLHTCNQTVLLVCSSGSTLDSVLLNVRENSSARILRLGPLARVNPKLSDICAESVAASGTFDQMKFFFQSAEIVGTTNGSHRQPALCNRKFDVSVVLECSLMLQPSLLGFLMLANRFVFVGDSGKHFSPRNGKIDCGMQESLMELLKEPAHAAQVWLNL